MPNVVDVTYAQSGKSLDINPLGMRDMQARAYERRNSQYLLLKAPPACGKSRALMFLGLDKLHYQGLEKVVVAVPERSIGSSFANTDLTSYGFFEDWEVDPKFNLCVAGGETSKVETFQAFMRNPDAAILVCTHATLRFACEGLEESVFDKTLLAIDEFHHVSADADNRLGDVLRNVMEKSMAHIVAMTGSYFRGDSIPVMRAEDEAKFTKVTYNYYEQLNGYRYLKSLGIGYHFYQGQYLSAIDEVLDTDKKTILHIPNVNGAESTKDKYIEVDRIIDIIGVLDFVDPDTQVHHVMRHGDGKVIRIANLVDDDPIKRDKIVAYLRDMTALEDMDLIIALGMAKEGFDWPYCEHALTVGYRGSLTEVIQIIGRATRDSANKSHAQFTNLIAQPDANDENVHVAVNNMLKAITASLLMEQVLAPNFKFKTRKTPKDKNDGKTIHIKGFKAPSTARVKDIVENDLVDLKAEVLNDPNIRKAMASEAVKPEVINQVLVPKIIETRYPGLSKDEAEEVRQYLVCDSAIKTGEIKEEGDQRFVRMANKFVNVEALSMDLIDSINPFQKAYEVLSKSVTAGLLKLIQTSIDANRINMTPEEAVLLYKIHIPPFMEKHGRKPDLKSDNPDEKRMAEAIIFLTNLKMRQGQGAS